jgi:hypothetical protein
LLCERGEETLPKEIYYCFRLYQVWSTINEIILFLLCKAMGMRTKLTRWLLLKPDMELTSKKQVTETINAIINASPTDADN